MVQIVLASFFTNLLVDGVCYSFGVLYVSLLEEFQETKAKTAWVGSLLPGCYLIIGTHNLLTVMLHNNVEQ